VGDAAGLRQLKALKAGIVTDGGMMSSIRDAASADTSRVAALDTVAAEGDSERASIECWVSDGSMRVAVAADEIVG
jgi:hypothetical protein